MSIFSTSISGYLRVTCHPWSCRAKVESRSSLCSSAKGDYVTQRTFSSFGRRAFAVADPFEWNNLPVSLRHESSINHSKPNLNSSSSNLLRIIYSGHYALNNIKRFRIRLVLSYRRSNKSVVLYCIVSFLKENRLHSCYSRP